MQNKLKFCFLQLLKRLKNSDLQKLILLWIFPVGTQLRYFHYLIDKAFGKKPIGKPINDKE